MTHETPAQRRTRLIEQYTLEHIKQGNWDFDVIERVIPRIADAVIAATPQETPKALDIKSLNYDGTPATRYPSEIETRLLELCELAIDCFPEGCQWRYKLAAIKRDLGLT